MAWIAPIAPSPRPPKPRWQARYQDGRRQLLKGEGTVKRRSLQVFRHHK
jgi:hypothetical protein